MTMKLVVFVVSACALVAAAAAAAMVPRDTKNAAAVNETNNQTKPFICENYTPCAWEIYTRTSESERPLNFIVNKYCICAKDTPCQPYQNDIETYTFIYRCLPDSKIKPARGRGNRVG